MNRKKIMKKLLGSLVCALFIVASPVAYAVDHPHAMAGGYLTMRNLFITAGTMAAVLLGKFGWTVFWDTYAADAADDHKINLSAKLKISHAQDVLKDDLKDLAIKGARIIASEVKKEIDNVVVPLMNTVASAVTTEDPEKIMAQAG